MWYVLFPGEFPDMPTEKKDWINKTAETNKDTEQIDLPIDNASATREALKNLDMQAYITKLFQTVRKPEREWSPYNLNYFSEESRALLKFAAYVLISKPSIKNVRFLLDEIVQLLPKWTEADEVASIITSDIFSHATTLHNAWVRVTMDNAEECTNLLVKRNQLTEQIIKKFGLDNEEERDEKREELKRKYSTKELELMATKKSLDEDL